jgi:hypothetical protein
LSVHIEGMGLQGALLAHRLHMYGVPFTWDDLEAERTAWKASTGAIYPATSTKFGPDKECWQVWKAWYEAGQFDRAHLEKSAGMIFATKNPPHEGKYGVDEFDFGIKRGQMESYHLNAQAFVPATRARFADRRVAPAVGKANAKYHIVAHGWGERLAYAYWGWTRLVELEYPEQYDRNGTRPAFYFRPNKYVMAYAYPVAGTPWFYSGSSIIKQRLGAFKPLDMPTKYIRWASVFTELAQGQVRIVKEGNFIEGWRPAAAETDTSWARKRGRVITLRPLWNNGIRHFPRQWAGVAELLGLVA